MWDDDSMPVPMIKPPAGTHVSAWQSCDGQGRDGRHGAINLAQIPTEVDLASRSEQAGLTQAPRALTERQE